MKHISLFEQFAAIAVELVNEKREDVGKYNTVKKVIAKIGKRPSEQDLAQFITDNYYDVTEVEQGEDDERANDKIADLVGFLKYDIKDWNAAWTDAQNESVLHEANKGKVHKAAKQGSYPAVIVVVQDGKVIHQEPVSTPEVAPATFNVMQEKYPKALIHLEDKTGKRLFSESLVSESSKGEKIKVYQKYNKKPTIAYIQGPVPNGKSNQYIAIDKQGNSIEVEFGLGLGTGQKDPVYMYAGKYNANESVVTESKVDMKGKQCKKCKKGIYKETGPMDDMQGVLHCDKCNHMISRYINESVVTEDSAGRMELLKTGRYKDTKGKTHTLKAGQIGDHERIGWDNDFIHFGSNIFSADVFGNDIEVYESGVTGFTEAKMTKDKLENLIYSLEN
jgi:hypothetical protein